MKPIRYATLSVISLFLTATFGQQLDSVATNPFTAEPGAYSVGFQLLEERDHSRVVTGGIGSRTHSRPIRAYVWYPAEGTGQAMRFGRYAALADEDIWPAEIAGSLRDTLTYSRRPLARSLSPAAFSALLQQPVFAVENAKPLDGPFPLIVIGQGLYYESPISFAALAEYLAGRGFVVATAPLLGTNSPFVRVDVQDLETQVRDLEFVIARARRFPFVSHDRLGILGFDMGGMAGVILTMRNRDVDAFMSLDAGILFEHPSGLPRIAPDYEPRALRVPWFHATGASQAVPPSDQAESLFETATYSDRYLLVPGEMDHVGFTTYGLIEGRSAIPGYWTAAKPNDAEGHRAASQYAFHFFAAFLANNAESRRFISRPPEESVPGGSRMTLEHRPAARSSITYDEFVQAVIAGRADEAINELRSVAAVEPSHILLDQTYLERLAVSLLNTWALTEEALAVVELMAELHPSSARAQVVLAEINILVENYPAAIEVYRRYVEQHPDDSRAQARLEWLRRQ